MKNIFHEYFISASDIVFMLVIFVLPIGKVTSAPPIREPNLDFLGNFDTSLFNYTCGTLQVSLAEPLDIRGALPFNSALFYRKNRKSDFQFFTAAGIVSTRTVFTVFGGAYGSTLRSSGRSGFKLPRPDQLILVAGINSTDLSTADKHMQKRKVKWIMPYADPSATNQEFYLVMVHLEEELDFGGSFVRPMCLPYPELYDTADIEFRIMAGFSLATPESPVSTLRSALVAKLPQEDCRKVYRFYYKTEMDDQFECARQREDTCLAYGSGYAILRSQVVFAGGMLVLFGGKRESICSTSEDAESIVFFFRSLNTPKIINWMHLVLLCGADYFPCPYSGDCIPLDLVCNKYVDCVDNTGADEDPIYCSATNFCREVTFASCYLHGPCIRREELCDGRPKCPNGIDEESWFCSQALLSNRTYYEETQSSASLSSAQTDTAVEPTEVANNVTCPLLQFGVGVETSCKLKGQPVPCRTNKIGTKLTAKCADFYLPKFRSNSLEITCAKDGGWKPLKSFACEADCGNIDAEKTKQQYLAGGQEVDSVYKFPWFGAMFLRDESSGRFNFICGSTLIEPAVVLTAAHCVKGADGDVSPEDLRIVLGSVSSVFEENTLANGSLVLTVLQHSVPRTFDYDTLFSDLAILKLSESIVYSERVQPACYLIKQKDDLKPGLTGKVSGYGKNKEGKLLDRLHWANFPVAPPGSCVTLYEYDPRRAFCAGHGNGTGVCSGDSGGGFVLLDEKYNIGPRYVLKGVVSKGVVDKNGGCNFDTPSVFTRIDAYNDWVFDVLELIDT